MSSKPRALCMLGARFTTELHLQPERILFSYLKVIYDKACFETTKEYRHVLAALQLWRFWGCWEVRLRLGPNSRPRNRKWMPLGILSKEEVMVNADYQLDRT